MKTRLVRLSTVLALVALLAFQICTTASAHDFPPADPTQAELQFQCFPAEAACQSAGTVEPKLASRLTMPLISSPLALYHAYQLLLLETTRPSAVLARVFREADWPWTSPQLPAEKSWLVARPDDGLPPSPKSLAALPRLHAKKQFLEDYAPYDLCIRDWRLGTAGWDGKHAQPSFLPPVTAEVEDPSDFAPPIPDLVEPLTAASAEAIVLGNLVAQIELAECLLSNWFFDPSPLQDWTADVTARINAVRENTLERLVSAWPCFTPPATPQPFYTEPQFVICETADGQQLVLTSKQAAQWHSERNPPADPPAVFLAQSMAPLKDQLMTQLSRRLENAGNAMLFLSRCVDELASKEVAQNAGPDIR